MINDNYRKVVSRNYTNDSQVTDANLPKSGFNLGYNSKYDGIIGRLHVGAVSDVMPADKFEGFNSGAITMNQIVTPITSNLHFRSHNFYVKYRSIDSDFEELMSPSKLNNMGANLTPPMFSVGHLTASIYQSIYKTSGEKVNFAGYIKNLLGSTSAGDASEKAAAAALLGLTTAQVTSMYAITDGDALYKYVKANSPLFFMANHPSGAFKDLYAIAKKTYAEDTLLDLTDQLDCDLKQAINASDLVRSVGLRVWKHIFDFFVGEGSQLERMGYIYADTSKLDTFWEDIKNDTLREGLINAGNVNSGYGLWLCNGLDASSAPDEGILQNEYKLRALLAIWIEYYRNVQLEPMTTDMRYRKWSSTSFLPKDYSNTFFTATGAGANGIGLALLITRCAPWSEDQFTTAHIDDVCRHVFVPIINGQETDGKVVYNTDTELVAPAQASTSLEYIYSGIKSQQLQYFDSMTMTNRTITVPLPSKVGNQFIKATTTSSNPFALDLFTMRQTERLERWLKRNYYFGDEYMDRTRAEFGVTLSDASLLRPKFYGGSIDLVDVSQQVAQVGTDTTQMGYRQAIASANSTGDGFGDFAEEFGCVIQIVSMIPEAQYDPTNIQNTYSSYVDFPKPVFANSNESIMHNLSLSRSLGYSYGKKAFGNVPYAYEWRSRVNEVHGKFLNEYSDWSDIRFFGQSDETLPKLNYQFIHCRPMIGYMQNSVLLDGQWYMVATHGFNVERALPAPVEVI